MTTIKQIAENRFLQGYACCLANIISTRGCNTSEEQAYKSGGLYKLTEKKMRIAGIDQYDIDIFKENNLLKR